MKSQGVWKEPEQRLDRRRGWSEKRERKIGRDELTSPEGGKPI
jgi:hypothetical protein